MEFMGGFFIFYSFFFLVVFGKNCTSNGVDGLNSNNTAGCVSDPQKNMSFSIDCQTNYIKIVVHDAILNYKFYVSDKKNPMCVQTIKNNVEELKINYTNCGLSKSDNVTFNVTVISDENIIQANDKTGLYSFSCGYQTRSQVETNITQTSEILSYPANVIYNLEKRNDTITITDNGSLCMDVEIKLNPKTPQLPKVFNCYLKAHDNDTLNRLLVNDLGCPVNRQITIFDWCSIRAVLSANISRIQIDGLKKLFIACEIDTSQTMNQTNCAKCDILPSNAC